MSRLHETEVRFGDLVEASFWRTLVFTFVLFLLSDMTAQNNRRT